GSRDGLRREALRYRFYQNPGRDNLIANWMSDQAGGVPTEGDTGLKHLWSQPLRLSSDRETENLLGEISSALEDGEVDRACRILIKGEVSNALAGSPTDPDLHQPAAAVLRTIIKNHPEMQQHLAEKYERTGLIRLGRARTSGDARAIEQIPIQFMGTKAANQALALLADRDFSMGHFSKAIVRYNALLPQLEGQEKSNLVAKRNLAMAMSGVAPAETISEPVELPGRSFSADEFEKMIQEALAVHGVKSSETSPEQQTAGLPPSGKREAEVKVVAGLPIHGHGPVGALQAGHLLLLQQHGLLTAFDLKQQKSIWTHGTFDPGKHLATVRPLVADGRLYTILPDGDGVFLKCFLLDGFKEEWKTAIQGRMVSDPVIQASTLFLLTVSADEYLHLNRIDAARGQPEPSIMLVRHVRDEREENLIRLLPTPHQLLIPVRGAVVACDPWGVIQWIRRMPFVPPEADPMLTAEGDTPTLMLNGDGVITCHPSSPRLMDIEPETGDVRWETFQPQRRFLLKRTDEFVVIRNRHSVEALDRRTGQRAWRSPVESDATTFVSGPEELLGLRLDPPTDKKNPGKPERWIKRYSSDHGEVGETIPVPSGSNEVHNIQRVFAWEGRLFTLSPDATKEEPHTTVAVIELK
ncbi:MAG: PQQ-binding-like beta-propeller repeat protein, partial [Verrucomicrobiota bacterium]